MNTCKTLFTVAVIATATLITTAANAQQYNTNYHHGSNYGNVDSVDWNIVQGTQYQNPRAAAIGGILGGIGQGLSGNPQNGTASSILGGIGAGLGQAAGRTDFSQGNITRTQQGYENRYGSTHTNYNPWPQRQGGGGWSGQGGWSGPGGCTDHDVWSGRHNGFRQR